MHLADKLPRSLPDWYSKTVWKLFKVANPVAHRDFAASNSISRKIYVMTNWHQPIGLQGYWLFSQKMANSFTPLLLFTFVVGELKCFSKTPLLNSSSVGKLIKRLIRWVWEAISNILMKQDAQPEIFLWFSTLFGHAWDVFKRKCPQGWTPERVRFDQRLQAHPVSRHKCRP